MKTILASRTVEIPEGGELLLGLIISVFALGCFILLTASS